MLRFTQQSSSPRPDETCQPQPICGPASWWKGPLCVSHGQVWFSRSSGFQLIPSINGGCKAGTQVPHSGPDQCFLPPSIMCYLSLAFFSPMCDKAHVRDASYSHLDSTDYGISISMSASVQVWALHISHPEPLSPLHTHASGPVCLCPYSHPACKICIFPLSHSHTPSQPQASSVANKTIVGQKEEAVWSRVWPLHSVWQWEGLSQDAGTDSELREINNVTVLRMWGTHFFFFLTSSNMAQHSGETDVPFTTVTVIHT